MGASSEPLSLGVVVERRASDHPWQRWHWRAVEIVPGLEAAEGWRLLAGGERWARFISGGSVLTLHRKETEDYKYALSAEPPQLYVVLRPAEEAGALVPFRTFLVTASPWEALAYQEHGEDRVEAVPMPALVAAWVMDFVARHHVDQPFFKRRRRDRDKAVDEASDFVRMGAGDDQAG